MRSKQLLVAFLALFFALSGFGQVIKEGIQKDDKVIVETMDGSLIYGFFVEKNASFMVVRSASLDVVTIPIEQIRRIKYVNVMSEVDGNGHPVDYHNSTRYLFSPSGYSLKKGQAYYENIWIFWNSFAYGVSDNFTLSASTELVSILFGKQFPLIFLNAKYSIPFKNDTGAFGINLSYLTLPQNSFASYAFLTGSFTVGTRNQNLTVGIGGGFKIENGFRDEVIPLFVSYMGRISQKLSFITENWFILQDDLSRSSGAISAGLRIHFKNPGSALNVMLARPLDDSFDFIGIPFVSGTVGIQ
jgi:hypothetical protein